MIMIDNKAMCTGCSACANICPNKCISMKMNKLGFEYPEVDSIKCVNCGICKMTCPIANISRSKNNSLLLSYAAQSLDDSIRFSSSSGGIFAILSQEIIYQNGVVFGAAFDETFHRVKHIAVETTHELQKLQGSKYIQSEIGSSYQSVKCFLEQGRKVLFSGTPCQIGGLRSFLSKDYDNLYLIDIVCHGIPAPKVWDEYIDYLEKKNRGLVVGVSFRDKRQGWRNYALVIKFDNGKEYLNNRSDDLYMKGFLHDYYLRSSCFNCNFKGVNRISDITLGDLWGIEKINPTMDDDSGTSLVIISSEKGKRLFEKIASVIKYQETNIEDVVKNNTAIVKSCNTNPQSISFEKNFQIKPINRLLKKYCFKSLLKRFIFRINLMIYKNDDKNT